MFAPVLPASGIGGWQYLQRTYDRQVQLFSKSPQVERDMEYFLKNISKVSSARELVADRRLLSVALGAFGLQDDINNKFFIQKILEEGTTAKDTLANRFSDNRYKDFSKSFALGPGESSPIRDANFANEIIEKFRANSFEVAIGEQDGSMRIALYAKRVMGDLVGTPRKSAQQETLEEISGLVDEFAANIADDAEYFEANIGKVETVDDLVSDKRLLEFSLKAFGLEDDFNEITSFVATTPNDVNVVEEKIRQILSEGSIAVTALANEIGDPRYIEFSKAFGFGIAEDLRTNDLYFASDIKDRFIETNFNLPESVDFKGDLQIENGQLIFEKFDEREMSNDAKWLTILGEPPLRSLFEKAFNLPSQFGQADIDQQLIVFKERSRKEFGTDTLSEFSDPEKVEKLIEKYLVRSQIASFNAATSSASIALTLLQS